MPSKTSTLSWTDGTTTSKTTIVTEGEDLPEVLCPVCQLPVAAWPGNSSGWFTGTREYYSTITVACEKCGRYGFPSYYQLPEQKAAATQEAIKHFLEHDNRPKICYSQL
jgi:hypothetical protein